MSVAFLQLSELFARKRKCRSDGYHSVKISGKIAALFIRRILHIICKVNYKELNKLPEKGPYIIAINHINFLEVPMIFVDLYPRKVHGVAKSQTWNNSFLGWLATKWEAIPINREGFTARTFRQVKEFLDLGRIVVIAPEGTRTGDGKLKEAHPGIITMAMQSNVPIIPVAHYGGELFWDRLMKLKRTSFTYKVGKPVILKKTALFKKLTRARQLEQLMYRLARLLPPEYRGFYSKLENINDKYVEEV